MLKLHCNKMHDVITEIAQQYGIDLTKIEAHLRLEIPDSAFMPLVIEVIGDRQISVAHYYKQNGDLIADPDVLFYTSGDQRQYWIPLYIQQPLGFAEYCTLEPKPDGSMAIMTRSKKGLDDLARFCDNDWASNIKFTFLNNPNVKAISLSDKLKGDTDVKKED